MVWWFESGNRMKRQPGMTYRGVALISDMHGRKKWYDRGS